MKKEYSVHKQALQQQAQADTLFSIPAVEIHQHYASLGMSKDDVRQGRFLKAPDFARTRDLRCAVQELHKCKAVRSSAQFIDVIQLGKHDSLLPPEGRPQHCECQGGRWRQGQ